MFGSSKNYELHIQHLQESLDKMTEEKKKAEKDLENIWDRYYKVDRTHRTARIGTGLGLSIVKGVLDIHIGHPLQQDAALVPVQGRVVRIVLDAIAPPQ